jgi:hypothetical protein
MNIQEMDVANAAGVIIKEYRVTEATKYIILTISKTGKPEFRGLINAFLIVAAGVQSSVFT